MDVDEIAFNDWQITKLRSALRRYRTLNKHGGRLPSWRQVRDDIANSDSNLEKYDADDAELAFKEEALRRFAENISNALGVERLRDVARFLLDEELLTFDALQEERQDLAAFLAMHEYFANDYEGVPDLVSAFSGTYTFKVPGAPGAPEDVTINLHLMPDRSGRYVRVEEVVQTEKVAERDYAQRRYPHRRLSDGEFISTTSRKGFGFPITRLNILHVFLDGATPGDRMTYIQAGELHEASTAEGFFLMRNGVATGRDQWARDIYYDEPVILPNICRFVPDPGQEA
ncbi:hypothetical protein [Pseudomonas asiatica]|uniref:hypothetical protein n=1 Tax=Pseudomonas asiatica TaxID=2219225 RepID=UPI0010C0F0D0|nr:hypothetical protein [Pseudomonas asiatica]